MTRCPQVSAFETGSAEEEVELLLEYYLERAVSINTEAQKLLSVARDMESSLSVLLRCDDGQIRSLLCFITHE